MKSGLRIIDSDMHIMQLLGLVGQIHGSPVQGSCVTAGARTNARRFEVNEVMPFVGAVAAPHSHLQLFTRPAENEDYKAKVARGRRALGVLREQVDKSGADTMLVIHDDHFVNFDFRCYPPFCLLIGKEARGSGVIDPAEIETITGAVYKNTRARLPTGRRPRGCRSTSPTGKAATSPTSTESTKSSSVCMLKELLAMGFDMPFTTNGTMDGELVLTQNF